MAGEGDEYFLPLEDQRIFGAGIKRKRITFVPSSSLESVTLAPTKTATQTSHDRYLSIIQKNYDRPLQNDGAEFSTTTAVAQSAQARCAICHLPLPVSDAAIEEVTNSTTAANPSHESSVAHQVCLSHSHPPSHLDREHVGLKYLSSYGWDPDSRQGLGATGEGIRIPIKAKIKNDTSGLGVDARDRGTAQKQKPPPVRLNAKQIRHQEAERKKREVKLRDAFYGKDLEQYLGPNRAQGV